MVRSDFKEFIETDVSVPSDLRAALKSNERVPLFMDKLSDEIRKADAVIRRRGGTMDRVKIKMLVFELTKQFVHFVKIKCEEHHMSDLAQKAIKTEVEGDELTKKLDDNGNADFTEELGVQIVDREPGRTPNKILE
jgi:hypothetical protein